MNESTIPPVDWYELHCPFDGALVLRCSMDTVGILEGKCRKCKYKHVAERTPDGNTELIISYR